MKAIIPILLFIAGIMLIARGNPLGSGLIAAAGLLALVLLSRRCSSAD